MDRPIHQALLVAAAIGCAVAPAGAQRAELLSTTTELRVCADPNDLPFSNQAGAGFENKIATVIAGDLKVALAYVWFPQVIGFVRNTLRARQCDLVMGTVSGDAVMNTTDPYYHTGYMLVTRADDHIDAHTITDPALAGKHFGIVAATPPTDLLLKHGLLANTRSYSLAVDTRFANPAQAMLQDLVGRTIDAALVWGPIAGYAIRHDKMPLRAVFLQGDPDTPRLDFQIAMGVRANEPEWRRRINSAIGRHHDEITALLTGDGVPLLDNQNRPIPPAE